MEISKRGRTILYISILLFSCIIGYRDITQTTISGAIIALFAISNVIVLPYEKSVWFTFFIMPFTCGIPGYTILGILLVLMIKCKHINIKQIIPPIVFGFLEFTHSVFYEFSTDYSLILSFTSFIFLFFFLLFDKNTVNHIECVKMFIWGSIIVLFIIYLKIILDNSIDELILGELRSGKVMGLEEDEDPVVGFLGMNANSIGYYSIAIYSSLLILGRQMLNMSKLSYATLLSLSIMFGLLSYSRTWILMAILTSILYLYSIKSTESLGSAFIILAIVLLLAVNGVLDQGAEVFTARFTDDNSAGGRFELFDFYNEFWVSDIKTFLLGAGTIYNMQVANSVLAIHNSTQQIYIGYGFIGLLFLIATLISYIKIYKNTKHPLIYYTPFIISIIFSQSIQFWYPSFLIFPFLATAYILRIEKDTH